MGLTSFLLAWVAKERRQSSIERRVAAELRESNVEAWLFGPFEYPEGAQSLWWHELSTFVFGERIREINAFRGDVDLVTISRLTNLNVLNAPHTSIENLAPIAELTELVELWIGGTPVSDLTPLAGLKNLEQLDVRRTKVSDLTPLAGLDQLLFLDLSVSPVDDLEPLAGLTRLEALDISFTAVEDLSPLHGLKQLSWLSIHGLSVSEEQVRALQTALPDCKINR